MRSPAASVELTVMAKLLLGPTMPVAPAMGPPFLVMAMRSPGRPLPLKMTCAATAWESRGPFKLAPTGVGVADIDAVTLALGEAEAVGVTVKV